MLSLQQVKPTTSLDLIEIELDSSLEGMILQQMTLVRDSLNPRELEELSYDAPCRALLLLWIAIISSETRSGSDLVLRKKTLQPNNREFHWSTFLQEVDLHAEESRTYLMAFNAGETEWSRCYFTAPDGISVILPIMQSTKWGELFQALNQSLKSAGELFSLM